jgi:hypothetical protein
MQSNFRVHKKTKNNFHSACYTRIKIMMNGDDHIQRQVITTINQLVAG